MTDLVDTFYNCASKILVADILEKDGEYHSRVRYIENELKRLREAMGESVASRVDELLCEQMAIDELREYACFQAGFRLALELTR